MSIEIEFEKRFIGVHELARILDVDAESICAKTSKRNRTHLNMEIPPFIKQGRLSSEALYRQDVVAGNQTKHCLKCCKKVQNRGNSL